jgi:hypothetical protein
LGLAGLQIGDFRMNELPCSPRILVDVASAALRIGNILQASRHQLGSDESLKNTFIYFTNMLMSGLAEANSEDVKCATLMKSIVKIKHAIGLSIKSTPGTHVSSGCLHVLDGYSTSSLGENLYRNDFHLTANEIWSITFSTKFWPLPFDVAETSHPNVDVVVTPQLDPGLQTPEANAPAKAELTDGKTSPDKQGARLKVESGLLAHFGFEEGAITKFDRLCVREFARDFKIKPSTCSEILRKIFLKDGNKRKVDEYIAYLLENDRRHLEKILARLDQLKSGPMNFGFFDMDCNNVVDKRTNPPSKNSIKDESEDFDEANEHLDYYSSHDYESDYQGGEDDSPE